MAILKNCRRAIRQRDKLLLVERVLPARMQHSIAVQPLVMSDLNMMVVTGGRERTGAEYEALVEAPNKRGRQCHSERSEPQTSGLSGEIC